MKKLPCSSLLMAIALAFAPIAHAGSGLRDEITDSFAVKPGGTLNFDSDLANVEITTSETETLRADFTREFSFVSAQEADALRQKLDVQMTKTGNDVKITVRWDGSHNDRDLRKVHVNFRIAMPRKFNLDLRTVGSGRISDLDGTVKAVVRGGSLQLRNVTGPVTARTDGGSIAGRDIGDDFEATSNGGSIAAARVNGKVMVRANGGSITIDECTDSIDARAAGGSVAAYLSKQPRSDSKLIADAGNVELRLPESIAVNIDASCSAGRLSSDFSLNGHQDENRLEGTINGGGPLVMVRASAGNIYLRK
jgi:Putative adhesin